MQKPHLPVPAGKLPRLMGDAIGLRTETCVNWGGPITKVPCLLKGNVYIKTKQWVCRVQKCIPLVGAETPFTCTGCQTTLSHGGRYRANNENLRKLEWTYRHATAFAPRQDLYQRKLWVCREQKCVPIVGAENPLTCAG